MFYDKLNNKEDGVNQNGPQYKKITDAEAETFYRRPTLHNSASYIMSYQALFYPNTAQELSNGEICVISAIFQHIRASLASSKYITEQEIAHVIILYPHHLDDSVG